MFEFHDKVAVVTGAGGAIGGRIAHGLSKAGAKVAIWDISKDAADNRAEEINALGGARAIGVQCDVVSKPHVEGALATTNDTLGTVDLLVNGAGGGHQSTTTSAELEFFDIAPDDTRKIIDLNYTSAVVPCQAVGRIFAEKSAGAIVNITSVGGGQPLSRALAYSNGKAACNSFTLWLAVHMATTYSPHIRVNAVAPGFMITEQNRFLLMDEKTDELTARGETVLRNVPMGRFGDPEEVVGCVLWLLSDQATFVTGAIVPVDGGFTAFDGV
jgi:NAD(P)-dependent dehydrogenase (short-subunit alcohol dehydrogenase family)